MAGRKSTASMELAIGATIIAGIIILVVMLMAWGNKSSLLGRHYRLVVNMKNVGGLKEGAPVKMGGFQIGRVATIQIQPGGTDMEIVLDIDENRILPKGSTAKVSTAGLVGDAFMEIVPGTSAEMIKRATTVADAERLESSPLPDMSELMAKVADFGDQLTILTTNLNDIVGDLQFRRSLKSMAVNLDAVSYQSNLILQRGQSVVDNVELASQNIAKLSDTLRDSVEKVTEDVVGLTSKLNDDIGKLTTSALEISEKAKGTIDKVDGALDTAQTTIVDVKDAVAVAKTALTGATDAIADVRDTISTAKTAIETVKDTVDIAKGTMSTIDSAAVTARSAVENVNDAVTLAKGTVTKATDAIENISGGVTEARAAINNTIGNEQFAADLRQTIQNVNHVTASLAGRREAIDQLLGNVGGLSEDLRTVAQHVKGITGNIEPTALSNTLTTLNAAIASMTEVVEKIKKEPVLALSMNKAADRIVKMKFDEMARQPHLRTSDGALEEINRWTQQSMGQGYLQDPAFPQTTRPYVLPERRAQDKRPYMVER